MQILMFLFFLITALIVSDILSLRGRLIRRRTAAPSPAGEGKNAAVLLVPLTIHNYHKYYITNDSEAHA